MDAAANDARLFLPKYDPVPNQTEIRQIAIVQPT